MPYLSTSIHADALPRAAVRARLALVSKACRSITLANAEREVAAFAIEAELLLVTSGGRVVISIDGLTGTVSSCGARTILIQPSTAARAANALVPCARRRVAATADPPRAARAVDIEAQLLTVAAGG